MGSHKTINDHILLLYIYFTTSFDCGHFVRQIKRVNTNIFYIYFTPPNKLYLNHEKHPCKEMHSDHIRIVLSQSIWLSCGLPRGLNSSSQVPTARQRQHWEIQHPELLYLNTKQSITFNLWNYVSLKILKRIRLQGFWILKWNML